MSRSHNCLCVALATMAIFSKIGLTEEAVRPENTKTLPAAAGLKVARDEMVIAQQTAYQVDPIKIRVVGHKDFKVHRIEVSATVPVDDPATVRNSDPSRAQRETQVSPNGKIFFFGACANNSGLAHWGDCRQYSTSFSMDVSVARRFETDTFGLNRPGYVIRGVKDGSLIGLDEDEKVLFFNGPPTTGSGTLCGTCPYRLVINTKPEQNEVVQTITMEPIPNWTTTAKAKPPTKLSKVVQTAIDDYKPTQGGPTLADNIADDIIIWLNSDPRR